MTTALKNAAEDVSDELRRLAQELGAIPPDDVRASLYKLRAKLREAVIQSQENEHEIQ